MSIEDRLRTQLEHASMTVPVVALDVEETLTKGHRARRVAFVRTVGAAAIVIGLGIAGTATLMNGEAERPIPPIGDRSRSPRPTATVTPQPTEAEMESMTRSWLEAIQDGDEDAAWTLMTEDARSEVGRDRFDDLMSSALPEGLGAFADPGVNIDIVELETTGGDVGIVATMGGSVEQEGTSEFRTEAIPLLVEAGSALVDEILEDRYEVVTVWTSASLGPMPLRAGDDLIMEDISPKIERVYLSIDGTSPAQRARFDPRTARAVVTLERTLDAGPHVATIVMVDADGRMFPVARPFEAASP